jgi:hypothetical protein
VLVLNLTTGHVSPQFHVKFDPKFQTVRESLGNSAPPSEWQVGCGFKSRKRTEVKKLEQSKEGTKEDHLQTQREEVEEQLDIPENQGMEMAEERRTSSRLKGKPSVDYNERTLARPREDEEVTFVTIAEESNELKEVFALAASKDPDTMYSDREEFKGAMKKEVEGN